MPRTPTFVIAIALMTFACISTIPLASAEDCHAALVSTNCTYQVGSTTYSCDYWVVTACAANFNNLAA